MFNLIFYQPLYNALIVLSGLVPGNDVGLAIVLLTVIVRLALFPLSHKALTTQSKLKEVEPKIKEIQKLHKDNSEEQARKMMALYKEHGVNPFASVMLLFIQIPILIALYMVSLNGLTVHADALYSFVSAPATLSPVFFGLIDLSVPNIMFGLLAGVTQFIQAQLSVPPLPAATESKSFKDDFARSMNMQTRYFFPIIIVVISLNINAAVVLYWVTSNIFSIGHELFVRRKARKEISVPGT